MAINTEIFPVRPVRRVIQVISVFMVDGQEMPRLVVKLSPAFGANQAMYLKGTLSIITSLWAGLL